MTEIFFEAVLFDLDGVVIDSNGPIVAFWRQLAAEHGICLTETDIIERIYGIPSRDTLDTLFAPLSAEQKDRAFEKLFQFENELKYTAIPGVAAFLERLRSFDIPTALVTSSEWPKVRRVFEQLNLSQAFTTVITKDLIIRGKPDPEGYQVAAGKLNIDPERCLVFEDAVSGVQAAVAAGAICIGVHQPAMAERLQHTGATCVIPDFSKVTLERRKTGISLGLGETGVTGIYPGQREHLPKQGSYL